MVPIQKLICISKYVLLCLIIDYWHKNINFINTINTIDKICKEADMNTVKKLSIYISKKSEMHTSAIKRSVEKLKNPHNNHLFRKGKIMI